MQNPRRAINELAMEIKKSNQNLAKIKTMIKDLIKIPIEPNTRIYRGRTLMHYAVTGNNSGVISLLSKIGVSVNLCDDNFNTPLHFAVLHKAYYSVCELIKIGYREAFRVYKALRDNDIFIDFLNQKFKRNN